MLHEKHIAKDSYFLQICFQMNCLQVNFERIRSARIGYANVILAVLLGKIGAKSHNCDWLCLLHN